MIEEPKECPNGHGPLKKIRGKQRCETCGWQSPRHERRVAEKEQHCKEESEGVTGHDVIKQKIDKKKQEEKCFIATACYGSELCPEIIALCRFRDKQLNATAWGRAFTRTYYRLSPILADVVRKHPIIRTILRRCIIKPILTLIQRYEANTGHPPT